jgi:mevalonate pyrophosphate decarboxylase
LYDETVNLLRDTPHSEEIQEAIAEKDFERAAELSEVDKEEFYNSLRRIQDGSRYVINNYGESIEKNREDLE